jgi:hypothetical protein
VGGLERWRHTEKERGRKNGRREEKRKTMSDFAVPLPSLSLSLITTV